MAASVTAATSVVERRETRFFCGPEVWGPGLHGAACAVRVVGGETAPVGEPETGARP